MIDQILGTCSSKYLKKSIFIVNTFNTLDSLKKHLTSIFKSIIHTCHFIIRATYSSEVFCDAVTENLYRTGPLPLKVLHFICIMHHLDKIYTTLKQFVCYALKRCRREKFSLMIRSRVWKCIFLFKIKTAQNCNLKPPIILVPTYFNVSGNTLRNTAKF